jgi:mediator of RNA polymerase II transcription subunit 7
LKIDDIRTLVINFHHILNEYRPHQARESAIAMMQSHLDRTIAETAAIKAQVDKAKRVLEGLGSIEIPNVPEDLGTSEVELEIHDKDKRTAGVSRENEVWNSSDGRFG